MLTLKKRKIENNSAVRVPNQIQGRDKNPKLIRYPLYNSRFDKFSPEGICIAPHLGVVVTDSRNDCLAVFSKFNKKRMKALSDFGTRGEASGQFSHPIGVCVQPITNHLIVCDTANHRLQVLSINASNFDQKGQGHQQQHKIIKPLYMIGAGNEDNDRGSQKLGELGRAAGVCCSHSGDIFVADCSNHRLQIYDCKGQFLRQIGSNIDCQPSRAKDGFLCPYAAALEATPRPHGLPIRRMIIADHHNSRLSLWDQDGQQHITNVQVQGNPYAVCVDLNGHILVSSNNHTVQIYDPVNLNLLQVIGTPSDDEGSKERGCFASPLGLCVDDDNNLYVCDWDNHRLQVF